MLRIGLLTTEMAEEKEERPVMAVRTRPAMETIVVRLQPRFVHQITNTEVMRNHFFFYFFKRGYVIGCLTTLY